MRNLRPLAPALLVAFVACSSGSDTTPPASPLLLTAGVSELDPGPADAAAGLALLRRVDLQRPGLGAERPRPTRTYELTTPPLTPFSFDVRSFVEGNAGSVVVGVAHVLDGDRTPPRNPVSLAEAGLAVTGPGLYIDGNNTVWMQTIGSGFGRITVRGAIERPQVLAVETRTETGTQTALVHIDLGVASAINAAVDVRSNHPGAVADEAIYSSDSWQFGLPTIAVSGDRTSIVVYEGDRATPTRPDRYEFRLQHDAATGAVTGGGMASVSADTGNWRDHELAALYNVLAVAQSTGDGVELRISYDRGATFAAPVAFDAGGNAWGTRLTQIAIAGDYSLALVYWRTVDDGPRPHSELVLVDGRPSAFDGTGSPTAYQFEPPAVIFAAARPATPLPMGLQWSHGGDLVVGYAYTFVNFGGNETHFECAVRPWQGEFTIHVVDMERIFGMDPSVALLGQGAGLQIYYAYEGLEGVRVAHLDRSGPTMPFPVTIGNRGAYAPTIFAREVGGAARVEVLYLDATSAGPELRASRWSVFGSSPREDFTLSAASITPVPPGSGPSGPGGAGYRIRQIAFFGYDAVQDGDDIVVVYDEEQFDAYAVCLGAPVFGGAITLGGPLASPLTPTFSNAAPPPLAPGMTAPVDAPDPGHRHQLRLLRLR